MAASYFFPVLLSYRASALDYLRMIALPVLAGFVIGGLLDRYVPREYVSKLLAKRHKRTVLLAVTLGFLMSACSHGILALSMELHKKGASTAVVVAFLLASPWANLPVTFMLIGFFGFKAFFIILSALFVALTTGLAFQALEARGWAEVNARTAVLEEGYSVRRDLVLRLSRKNWSPLVLAQDAKAVWRGALSLADMTLGWILLGVLFSGLASAYVPHEWFHRYMGPTVTGLLVTLALATVLEVCSEGTSPMAFTIYQQSGAFGNALVFLMAGVVTDLTEIGAVWQNVGKKAALWIPAIAVPQVILLGMIANRLF